MKALKRSLKNVNPYGKANNGCNRISAKDPSQAHTYNYQGYSILPKEGLFCKVIESGEIEVGDMIRLIED